MIRRPDEQQKLKDDPHWFKDAVIYELRVRSFSDSNGDGVGDFAGLTSKLSYLQDLGVSALWLLPICPSPGRDDGYDISDYTDVHPDVGTLDDFRAFLAEAHRLGLRVITELVMNHTSDQHPWFQRARRAPPGSPDRNFYVWSDTPDRYRDARIIFKDFEPSNWSWDPVAKQYYWHRFFAHQPDLNFENPAVQDALLAVVDFWFGLGVDGLRLDAVPYLYEEDGTNCENLPKTHVFLKRLRAHVDARFQNRMLLAEANQWPEDAAAYFGQGDECHMNFHFPIMPRIFMSIHMEDRLPIMDILAQTPVIPDSCQWALFLRNHDELTLEMVTEDERDYMYRAFASDQAMRINLGIRRRLAPLVGNNRRNIELMNGLLFSLPGTPVLYYGDEIGMGDNVFLGDRNGVRTPMQWSADRNAGFSRANPQRLILPIIIDPEYHYESMNVEAQQQNPNSLLWWMKRLIALRKRFQAFGRGTIEFLQPDNPRVLAFIRQFGDETVLVVANLSRFIQYVELDLKRMKGKRPVELFGKTAFPPIGELPYLLTLGGHAFYWFSLADNASAAREAREAAYQPAALEIKTEEALRDRPALESILPGYIEGRRWFRGRDREIARAVPAQLLPLPGGARLAIVRIEYVDGEPDLLALPLAVETGDRAAEIRVRAPQSVLATLRSGQPDDQRGGAAAERGPLGGPPGILYDALAEGSSATVLLDAIRSAATSSEGQSRLIGSARAGLPAEALEARLPRAEHRSAAVAFGDSLFLKFFRTLSDGISPELEIGRFLARRAQAGFPAPVPELVGSLELRTGRAEPITIATLHAAVANEGTAWDFTRGELRRYWDRALAKSPDEAPPPRPAAPLVELGLAAAEPDPAAREILGNSLLAPRILGRRLAELHRAFASAPDDPAFSPEPYSALDQRSVYQTRRNLTGKVLREVHLRLPRLTGKTAELAQLLLSHAEALYKRFDPLIHQRLTASRGRFHGDFHLGKALYTGKDFVIVDFEGDAQRPLADRRRKRSPLRDVVSMIRSFEWAASTTLRDEAFVRAADRARAEPWGRLWLAWAHATFLGSYLAGSEGSPFVPRGSAELALLLDTLLLERTLEELGSELDKRPDWAILALRGLYDMLA